MAALVFDTGVPSHPQIKIKQLDLEAGQVTYQWIGGPYNGDCSEVFVISIAVHGTKTVAEVVQELVAQLIAKLPEA